ncbi:AraC family transcriptional regulator [Christiangramia fulva]|uniref:AraC family transcriptional regulator n=1 Tax=Christiangramia fulva TaxID=2126553 RepID=A0A2R3Z8I3_9FLAO|nr:AraC family transcriptional regulator [Christiangramia fulva]AVR46590.1 AraC family transcriptional regulator [Christiangramia fulva]
MKKEILIDRNSINIENHRVIQIKNVVCQRCKRSVREILTALKIPFKRVSLGEAELERDLSDLEFPLLQEQLHKVGFELIFEKNERLVNQIKSIIIARIYKEEDFGEQKISDLLINRLHYDYSHLTHIFTKLEGKNIQKFHSEVKIERIKELLEYNELTISEIAHEMGYSSATYLSTQFKKPTGVIPSDYKNKEEKRKIDLNRF